MFPFFHIGGLSGLYVTTAVGSKLVTMYKWDVETAVDLLAKERITSTAMVPTVLRQLLDSPLLDDAAARGAGRHRVRRSTGTARPHPPHRDRSSRRKVSPANGYGLTETTSAVVINAGRDYFDNPDSVGRPCRRRRRPHRRRRRQGPAQRRDRRAVGARPERRQRLLEQAGGHGGGVHRRLVPLRRPRPPSTTAGFIFVVDRLKDVVIRGGENIYSAEVEAVLFEHPAVLDVAIVGLPHDVYGEEVAAVVQLRDGHGRPTPRTCSGSPPSGWPASRCPSTIVFRAEPLPRTATGKVLKRELRDELTDAGGTPS